MTIVYTATQDLDAWADDPRTWDDTVTIRIYRAGWGLTEETEPLHATDDVFARLLEAGADEDAAARGAARYARLSGDGIGHVEVRTLRGYSQSDWWDVVTFGLSPRGGRRLATWVRLTASLWTLSAASMLTMRRRLSPAPTMSPGTRPTPSPRHAPRWSPGGFFLPENLLEATTKNLGKKFVGNNNEKPLEKFVVAGNEKSLRR